MQMDPFRRQVSVAERDRIVIAAFATAGQRLKSCALPKRAAPASQPSLSDQWATCSRRSTQPTCGVILTWWNQRWNWYSASNGKPAQLCAGPKGPDEALLLIARLHEGT